MITLESDTLTFSFPEIGQKLRQLVEDYVHATMPRLLAEDRQKVRAALESHWIFKEQGADEQALIASNVLDARPEGIEFALRKKCLETAWLNDYSECASVQVHLQRTLRIPDDGNIYPLPAGLGNFPLRHVDDYAAAVPESWLKRGGVMMPMHQSEALWIDFDADYPFALKVGAGKINAVTGESWISGLQEEPQNYLVLPEQPWLDGFAVSKGVIRQFVAMPLGDGYSVEEQLTGSADVGGIQLQVIPLETEAYFRKELAAKMPGKMEDLFEELAGRSLSRCYYGGPLACAAPDMGLGAGGTMRQEIYKDRHDFADWDVAASRRCFIHLCNSLVWRQITGSNPPQPALTAREYAKMKMPWFDYYRDDLPAVEGSKILDVVKSVFHLGEAKGTSPLPENTTIQPHVIVQYGNTRRPGEVREWVDPDAPN